MLPVEKMSSSTVQNLLIYVSLLSILIFIAAIIRLKVKLLRKAFIPASLLAGVFGMILGPHVLKIIPADIMSSIGALPSSMISIVFSAMFIGVARSKENIKSKVKTLVPGVVQFYVYDFFQVGLACLLTALIFTPLFGTNPLFGSTFEIGFLGGHGTAAGMIEVFNSLNWPDGGDIGNTTATMGLLSGIFGGMLLINIGVRRRWTKHITEKPQDDSYSEIYAEPENRPIGSSITINKDVVETFAFHFALIGIALIIGWIIVWIVKTYFNFSLPLFPFAMIGGWIVNKGIQSTSLKDMVDRNVLLRIQGLALEILIASAVSSVSLPVVVSYWKELLIGYIVIMLSVLFVFLWLTPRIFQDEWFEHGIMRYGAATGVAAVGYMLMRICDPDLKGESGSMYALSSIFMSPYIGGGLVTTAYPYLILRMGSLKMGILFTALSLALILFLRIAGFWNKELKLEQREELVK